MSVSPRAALNPFKLSPESQHHVHQIFQYRVFFTVPPHPHFKYQNEKWVLRLRVFKSLISWDNCFGWLQVIFLFGAEDEEKQLKIYSVCILDNPRVSFIMVPPKTEESVSGPTQCLRKVVFI